MITKIQAATLYAYGYRMIGRDDKKFNITELHENGMWIKSETGHYVFIKYTQIAVDYFILARPLEQLTARIDNCNGSQTCSLIDYWNIALKDRWEFKPRKMFLERKTNYGSYSFNMKVNPFNLMTVHMVEDMVRFHFNIGFPEGTVKPLK